MIHNEFVSRHIGSDESDTKKMLESLELESVEELLSQTIPKEIRLTSPLSLPEGISENKFLNELRSLSEENKLFETYIGLGYYSSVTPAVIQSLPSRNCPRPIRGSI